jgi:plastocyanin
MRRLLAATAVFVALTTACGSSGHKAVADTPVDLRGKAAVDVDAVDNVFKPAHIIVSPGTRVTWTNHDNVAHNVLKATDSLDFHGTFGAPTDKFGPGATYSYTFGFAGHYPYACTIHTFMTGVVDVEA